jgi:uncharacterized protein (DUF433 family)
METKNETQETEQQLNELREQVRVLREKLDMAQTYVVTEHPHIYTSARMHNGEPTIRGTSLTVRTIVGCISIGESIDEILEGYPFLTRAQVHDALSYYYDHTAEIDGYIRANEEALWRVTHRAST